MPDQPEPATDAPTLDAPATGEVTPPPWGDDFDPQRAWRLVQNLREDNAKAKARLAEYDAAAQARADAERSELERATARAERAEKTLADREAAERRAAVLKTHGLTDDDAAFLAGVGDDELDARARALAARLAAPKPTAEVPARPEPVLTPAPGHESAPVKGLDPLALAERLYKTYRD